MFILKLIINDEFQLSHTQHSEKKKFYELYKELLKRTENSLGGVYKINSKPDSLMFAILKDLSGESDSSEELTM